MSAAARVTDTDEPPVRRLYRSADGRWLGGVARGLAGHLGLPVVWVRVIFLVLFFMDGLGLLIYAAFWIVVPLGVGGRTAPRPVFETTPDGRRRLRKPDRGQIFALIALAIGAAVLVGNISVDSGSGRYIWPLILVSGGVALVWRQADNARRASWTDAGATAGPSISSEVSSASPWSAPASRSSWWSAAPSPSSARPSPPPSRFSPA